MPVALTCRNCCGLVFSFIGMVLGFAAFTSFMFFYHNAKAGLYGLISGILALIVFVYVTVEFMENMRERIVSKTLLPMRLVAFSGIIIGLFGIVDFIYIQVKFSPPILPVETSEVIPFVWAFMTFKWAVMLFFTLRRFSRLLNEEQSLLVNSGGD